MTSTSVSLRAECEEILRKSRDYNLNKGILKTDVATINYLLTQGAALATVYDELWELTSQQREQLLDQLVSTISFWSPSNAIEMRANRSRLIEVNNKIAIVAGELANLLKERSMLENKHPFTSHTHYHIVDVLEQASSDNHLFKHFLAEPIGALAHQFDLKYWPSLAAIIDEISTNAESSEVVATDSRTDAATWSNRSSKADFVRALLSMIDELTSTPGLGFDPNFNLSDSGVADIVNVCLRLDVQELVDGAYVKNLRHRDQRKLGG